MEDRIIPSFISSEEISLLRELLSLLVCEECLLMQGQKEERKLLCKRRYAVNRKIRFLKNQPHQLTFFDEFDTAYLQGIYDALEKEILLQRKRNIALLKYGGLDTLKKNPAIAPKVNKPRLLTLDPDLYHDA